MNKVSQQVLLSSLREELQTVDYSKWERTKTFRSNGLKSTKPKIVHWSASCTDHKEARSSHRPITGRGGNTTQPNEKKHLQPEKSGAPAASSRLSRRTLKNTKKEHQESISRSDQIQTQELLIRLQRWSIADMGRRCEDLQEANQKVIRDIENTERDSFSSVRESLNLHQKLGNSVSALKRWSDQQIRQAKSDLKNELEEAENHLSGLQAQLKAVTADVADAQAKLRCLKTYKDMEYPVKALQITEMKRELEMLKQVQQAEYEEVKRLCQAEMTRLETQLIQRQHEVMSATAQQKLSQIPPAVIRMAAQNRAMKAEIDSYKKSTYVAISTDLTEIRLCKLI
uniref:Myosin-1-like n=1 Tax=Astyanax mexicanus TaxID=7994 RepID=A0A3B1JWR4_ASTMX